MNGPILTSIRSEMKIRYRSNRLLEARSTLYGVVSALFSDPKCEKFAMLMKPVIQGCVLDACFQLEEQNNMKKSNLSRSFQKLIAKLDKSKIENIDAYVHGPLAFDNAISPKAAQIKKIQNEVAGKADIILVPKLETGNSLSKIMVYFLGACAAGIIVGGKVPIVVTSRADCAASRLASIAAAIIAAQ